MIDYDLSAVARPICGQTSAEVKSYTQHCCCGVKMLLKTYDFMWKNYFWKFTGKMKMILLQSSQNSIVIQWK